MLRYCDFPKQKVDLSLILGLLGRERERERERGRLFERFSLLARHKFSGMFLAMGDLIVVVVMLEDERLFGLIRSMDRGGRTRTILISLNAVVVYCRVQ